MKIKPITIKIASLEDILTKERCQRPYNFVMSCDNSSYKEYVQKGECLVRVNEEPGKHEVFEWKGIECALWPMLYPYTSWCESTLDGASDRASAKASFLTKCFSSIIDYSMTFDLLQFHFDTCMYKTITGAINEGRYRLCSPYTSLAKKTFSPAFWEWQNRYLLDVVRQKGYLSLFITISPSEWTFTTPKWLDELRETYAFRLTETALFETYHFVTILEQVVRGYLCGSNDQRWTDHLFNYNRIRNRTSVKTFFYRFEFQGRGTVHLHLLVWLDNFQHTQYHTIRADIPSPDDELHGYVMKHQVADKSAPGLIVQEDPTYVKISHDK